MSNPWDAYSNEFTTPQAPTGPYADLVPQAAQQFGVPLPVMNWVGYREGGWNSKANGIPTSSGRAQGNWQFMPATAQGLSVDPNDPASSTFGAAKLLRQNYDQTGNWTEAVRRYGTFSSGRGQALDNKLESGFITHMLNSGMDPGTTPPTGPVQVGAHPIAASPQQAIDPASIIAGFSQGGAMPDPTSAAAIAQQTPGDTGGLSAATLLRMAAGFAGKKTFGQGLSAAAQGAADGMLQDQQIGLAQQQRAQDQQRIGIQQQSANTAQADGRARVVEQASRLAELGIPPDKALQVAMAAYQGPGQAPAAAPAAMPAAAQPPITGAGPGTPQPLPPGLSGPAPSPAAPSMTGAGPGTPQGLPPGLAAPAQAPSGASGSPVPAAAASGSRPPIWHGMPDLSTLPSTGGKSTAGDLFYAPDGTAFQERNHPYGNPTYFNTANGQVLRHAPPRSHAGAGQLHEAA